MAYQQVSGMIGGQKAASNTPQPASSKIPQSTPESSVFAGQGVGRLGIEPRTRGLKVRCSAN
jgi:hypothetical protein